MWGQAVEEHDDATRAKRVTEPDLDFRYEVSGSTIYIGEAAPGTTDATPAWRIQKIDTSTGKGTWADGVASFTKAWVDRATYTY